MWCILYGYGSGSWSLVNKKSYCSNIINRSVCSSFQVKNRTKKRSKMRRKKPSETEQLKTNLPPIFLVPALAPVPCHSFQRGSAHYLPLPFASLLPAFLTLLTCTPAPCLPRVHSGPHIHSPGVLPFLLLLLQAPNRWKLQSSATVFISLYFAASSVAKSACLYL